MNFGSNPELFEYLIPRSEAIGSEPGGGVARRSCMSNRAAPGTHQATLQWSGAKGEVGDRGLKKLTVAEEVGVVAGGILQWGKKVERGQVLLKPTGEWKDCARWSSSPERVSQWQKWLERR
jgi:hypothetical protein